MTLKEIALELLEKYRTSETSCIWEFSGDIDESEKRLSSEVQKYKELIETTADVVDRKRGEWILCDNRLPDKDGEYLVTTKKWNGLNVEICSFDKGDIEKPFCPTNKNSKCSAHGYKASTIIAWMPLPEPYYGVDMRGENK